MPFPTDAAAVEGVITEAKQTPERAWLGEVSAVVLQQALADLNTAYRNFFASLTGKRKGRKVAAPRFRSTQGQPAGDPVHQERPVQGHSTGRLRLPKIGDVQVRWSRDAALRRRRR